MLSWYFSDNFELVKRDDSEELDLSAEMSLAPINNSRSNAFDSPGFPTMPLAPIQTLLPQEYTSQHTSQDDGVIPPTPTDYQSLLRYNAAENGAQDSKQAASEPTTQGSMQQQALPPMSLGYAHMPQQHEQESHHANPQSAPFAYDQSMYRQQQSVWPPLEAYRHYPGSAPAMYGPMINYGQYKNPYMAQIPTMHIPAAPLLAPMPMSSPDAESELFAHHSGMSSQSSPVPSDSELSTTSNATNCSKRSSKTVARSGHKEKKYFCPECGDGFARNFNLKSHIACKHRGEKPFACTMCPKTFSRKHDTARHLSARHGFSHEDAAAEINSRYPAGSAGGGVRLGDNF